MTGEVLIIEDNQETRDLYRLALNGNDIRVRAQNSAAEALSELQNGTLPHLILCDYMMPGMDGASFIREVRANVQWRHIRIILISGIEDLKALAQTCGADDYLKKPFGLDELEEIVLNHLAKL